MSFKSQGHLSNSIGPPLNVSSLLPLRATKLLNNEFKRQIFLVGEHSALKRMLVTPLSLTFVLIRQALLI